MICSHLQSAKGDSKKSLPAPTWAS